MQPHAVRRYLAGKIFLRGRVLGRLEKNLRLGFGKIFAQKRGDIAALPADVRQHLRNLGDHHRVDARRALLHFQARVGINAGQRLALCHPVEKFAPQFLKRRRAEADGIGHALANGDAVVRPVRRQVEQIAGFQHPVVYGAEIFEDAQRRAFDDGAVALVGNLPAPPANALQQENIVIVKMRADAAAIDGVADHEVVQPRVGNEGKMAQQAVGFVPPEVQALHQHCPGHGRVAHLQALFLLRAVLYAPLAVLTAHQTRFHIGIARQREQLVTRHQPLKTGHGLAHQQRLLLPVFGEKFAHGKPAQQRFQHHWRQRKRALRAFGLIGHFTRSPCASL